MAIHFIFLSFMFSEQRSRGQLKNFVTLEPKTKADDQYTYYNLSYYLFNYNTICLVTWLPGCMVCALDYRLDSPWFEPCHYSGGYNNLSF